MRFLKLRRLGEHTGIAGRQRLAWVINGHLPVKADGGARYQRLAVFDGCAIDGVARGEVVAAVQHDVGLLHQRFQQRIVCPRGDRGDLDIRVEVGDGLPDRLCLEFAHTGQLVGNLPLQVGGINPVIVNNGQPGDACTAQVKGHRRTKTAGTHDEGA